MVNHYFVEGSLGSGAFAKVFQFVDQETGVRYAAKKMNKAKLKKTRYGRKRSAYDAVVQELETLQTIEHPNVIWLHEVINDDKNEDLYIVTEYYSGGSLESVIEKLNVNVNKQYGDKKTRGLGSWQVRLFFIDMLRALHYIHNVIKVIHKDIKPDNIMIGHNQEAILIDFGVAVQLKESEMNSSAVGYDAGTYLYYAPELFQLSKDGSGKQFGEATDIWAMGMSFYYVLTGTNPFEDAQDLFHLKNLIETREINFDLITNQQAREVISRMLVKDPAKRATLPELIKMAWVTDNGTEDIDIAAMNFEQKDDLKAVQFGNIKRLLTMQKKRFGMTAKNLFA